MSYNRAEIDTEAWRHNFRLAQELVGPDVKLLPAVKANGYGLGVMPMVRTLADEGAWGFCVATVDEGLELRANDIKQPVLILGAVPPEDFAKAIYNDLALTVFCFDSACLADVVAAKLNKQARVHVKLDTGMHRLGFACNEQTLGRLRVMAEMPNLRLAGLFSHLPQADNDPAFTAEQIHLFREYSQRIADAGISFELRHLANSIGTCYYPDSYLDLTRPGIMLHGCGIEPPLRSRLQQALTLKSTVVRVHTAAPGAQISYGGTFTAESQRRIATIPLGYADGYFRAYSNKGCVLIHGRRAPIAGRVCMDQFMVDVTDIPHVAVGDEVVLYGRQGDDFLSIDAMTAIAGTIPQEALTALGSRIPKVYLFDDED